MSRRGLSIWLALAGALVAPRALHAGTEQELGQLRAAFEQMRQDYETRMGAMEARLNAAEAVAREAQARVADLETAPAAVGAAATGAGASPNAFNPSIGLILDGKYRAFSRSPADPGVPGFALGEEAGPGAEGFSLGESELQLDANIDHRFRGVATLALADEGGETAVELENAFVQTTSLGRGMTLRAGRFYSGIGYMNSRHAHTDDFADRPLLYRALLNDALADDGVQVRWVAPTDLFIELGGELLRGAAFPAGGNDSSGKGAWSSFAHAGGDVGTSHSWTGGIAYLSAEAHERESGDGDTFSGDVRMWLADFVWKWAPDGNAYSQNLQLQGEIAWLDEDGRFTPMGGSALALSTDKLGWYAQGVYQFRPGWRAGLRYGELHADEPGAAFAGTALDRLGHTPRQLSVMADWSPSEFSRVRIQYSVDRSAPRSNSRIMAQYLMSLGAHGAHRF